jgi:hypothetical protein
MHRLALALLALAASGCMTGHALEAARRREQVLAYREAFLDGNRLVLGYRALVSNDEGEPVAERDRWAAIELADLRGPRVPPVEDFPVAWLDGPPTGGRPAVLRISDADSAGPCTAADAPYLDVERVDGRHTRVVLRDAQAPTPYAPLHSAALTRVSTVPWVYPLVPLTLAVDAVVDPVLLFFAPAVLVVGD